MLVDSYLSHNQFVPADVYKRATDSSHMLSVLLQKPCQDSNPHKLNRYDKVLSDTSY